MSKNGNSGELLIASGTFDRQSLAGKVVVITGAGGGIGYEAARSLRWLGAKIIIAEINKKNGRLAEERLCREFGAGGAFFINTDVGDGRSIERLRRQVFSHLSSVDIVINNATLAPLGAVWDTPIQDWDSSYRVNLRGPVLLARSFLPGMLARNSGVFICVSSLGTAFMGAYEALKAAQVHLGNTLDAELQGTGVSAFTIGPGFVPTQTALDSIPRLAALMDKSTDEMFTIVNEYKISVEAAGAGFAAAVVLAERYRGQEISSSQALIDAGISLEDTPQVQDLLAINKEQITQALELCRRVRSTLAEQSAGWEARSVFEKQWMIRTFRNRAKMPIELWLETLNQLETNLEKQDSVQLAATCAPLASLANFYVYLYDMAKGYVKDPQQREEQLAIVKSWQTDVEELDRLLGANAL